LAGVVGAPGQKGNAGIPGSRGLPGRPGTCQSLHVEGSGDSDGEAPGHIHGACGPADPGRKVCRRYVVFWRQPVPTHYAAVRVDLRNPSTNLNAQPDF